MGTTRFTLSLPQNSRSSSSLPSDFGRTSTYTVPLPRCSRDCTRKRPMKPVAPVTKYVMELSPSHGRRRTSRGAPVFAATLGAAGVQVNVASGRRSPKIAGGGPRPGTCEGARVAMPNHERMSSVDTAWLRMDSPGSSMMIVGVSATATPVRPDDFRGMLEQRLLCFARFRQRAVGDALGASWVEDQSFDLDAHLKLVTLPAPAGKSELEALASELASTSLDPRRPLWQFHFVPQYLGGSAWVMRVHHCYADGIAMVRVLLSMTEQDPAPALAPRASARRSKAAPRAGPDVLPILNWVEQFAQPAEDIVEHALAEGAKLLEGGIHQLFHPDRL